VSLDAHLDVAPTPDAVEFTCTVENAGVESVDLEFRNGMTADVAVFPESETDEAVWRWSDGRMFTQALRTVTLAPGESLTEALTWPDPSPGSYTAEASLAAADVEAVARATFDVA
jgi:hypothetical protein